MKNSLKIICMFLCLCLITASFAACSGPATVGTTADGDTISKEIYLYFMYDAIDTGAQYAAQNNMTWKQFAKELLSEDQTIGQYFDEQTKTQVEAFVISEKIYKELDITLTVDEKTQLQKMYDTYVTSLGGRSALRKRLRKLGMEEERYKEIVFILMGQEYYNKKIDEKLTGENGETPVNDETVKELLKEYVRIKHILKNVSTTEIVNNEKVDLTESEIKEAKEKAVKELEELVAKYKAGEKFDDLMDESDDTSAIENYPYGYVFKRDGGMKEVLEDAAFEMEIGETKIVESTTESNGVITSYNEHLILKLDVFEDLSKAKEEAVKIITNEKYKAWEEKYAVKFDEKALAKYSTSKYNPIV